MGCDFCGGERLRPLFRKIGSDGREWQICECRDCRLVQLSPRPTAAELSECYSGDYFLQRSDRGYNNYYTDEMRSQLERVWELNLRDLGFFAFESELRQRLKSESPELVSPRALDVGCAAGYFVDYMARSGWQAQGVEISAAAAAFGCEKLGLTIHVGDLFDRELLAEESFDLVTLWASLEHFPSASAVLARCYRLLRPGGMMILTTCRWGLLSRLQRENWRYMNLPEHIFFFPRSTLETKMGEIGFTQLGSISYGSGFTTRAAASLWYRLAKRIADPLVRHLHQGDMIAVAARRQ